jgi:hypothetical protein
MPMTSPLIWILSLSQGSFLILLERQMRAYLASGEVNPVAVQFIALKFTEI